MAAERAVDLIISVFRRSANLISPDASRFRARRAQVEIKVQDFGEGIPVEKLEHVFDRIYRGNDSITMAGFGPGLSKAKSLMDTMNGNISLPAHTMREP
jgi:signal transduction histidine kinase